MSRAVVLISCVLSTLNVYAEDVKLEEVVVTALRDTRDEQSVPAFVSVIDSLEQYAGQQAVLSLSNKAPAIRFMQSSGPLTTTARIHGIGSLGNLPNFETDVGLYVQDAYQPRHGLLTPQLFDLSSIEVVSGSQATLYGRNVNAGAILVNYKEPTEGDSASVDMTMGLVEGARTAPSVTATGFANFSVGNAENARFRISYKLSQAGAIDKNLNPGASDPRLGEANDAALRFQVSTDVGSGTVTAMGFHAHNTAVQGDSDVYYGTTPAALNTAFGVPCPDNDAENGIQCASHGLKSSLLVDTATVRAAFPLSESLSVQSLSGWSQYESQSLQDADQLNIQLLEFNDKQRGLDWQQELRLRWRDQGRWSGAFGGYYHKSHFDRLPADGHDTFELGSAAPLVPLNAFYSMGTSGASGSLYSNNRNQHLSVFAEASAQISPTFTVDASLRYITDRKTTHIAHRNSPVAINLINAVLLPASVDADLSRKTHGIAWNITPQLKFGSDATVFATLARGFKPGGFNADWGTVSSSGREFDDESVDHRALGIKWHNKYETARVSLVGFNDVYKQYQDGSFIGLQFIVGNAEEVRSSGIDLVADAALPAGIVLNTSLSYATTHYEKFSRGSCYYGRTPDSATNAGACDLSGETLPNAPKLKSLVGLSKTFGGASRGIDTSLTWSHTSSYLAASSLDPRSSQDSIEDVGVKVNFRPADNISVSVWGNNLLNERAKLSAAYMNLFSGNPAYQVFLSPGRSAGVTASVNF